MSITTSPILEGAQHVLDSEDELLNTGFCMNAYAPPGCDCEDVDNYGPGGFHPIAIGDWITENYRIMHKLGAGGSATVWLGRDQRAERYVAIKIMSAMHSQQSGKRELAAYSHLKQKLPDSDRFIVPLLDNFEVEGPNGKHLCLVLGLHGPSLQNIATWETPMKIRPDIAQDLAKQVTEALQAVHSIGVTCSDFSTGNILLGLTDDIHSWSIEQLCEYLGPPVGYEVELYKASDEYRTTHAPTYVYPAINFAQDSAVPYLKPEVRFVDFAEVQLADDQHSAEDSFGLTISYADPESIMFQERHTQASDIWALACIIFELRSGDVLHGATGNPDDVQRSMVSSIGPLPQDWVDRILAAAREEGIRIIKSSPNERTGEISSDVTNAQDESRCMTHNSRLVNRVHAMFLKIALAFSSLKSRLHAPPKEEKEEVRYTSIQMGLPLAPTTLEQTLKRIGTWTLWCSMSIEQRMSKLSDFKKLVGDDEPVTLKECDTGPPPHNILSQEETDDLLDLLSLMLRWERKDRASLEEVLQHRWFSTHYGRNGLDGDKYKGKGKDSDQPWLQRYHRGWQYSINGGTPFF